MGEVIKVDFRSEYVTGTAYCHNCEHEWEAVLEVPRDTPEEDFPLLECPSCKVMAGELPPLYEED